VSPKLNIANGLIKKIEFQVCRLPAEAVPEVRAFTQLCVISITD
jgi:hypothetical protein